MRHIKIVGLCLLVVFALSALVAAAAQAEEHPEWAGCVAQKKGEYTESKCATKSAKAHKGSYEKVAGQAATCVKQKKGEYTNSSCTTKAAKAHKGSYEVAAAAKFKSEGKTGQLKGVLTECENEQEEIKRTGPCYEEFNHSKVTVQCTSESGEGEASGSHEVRNVVVKFHGCLANVGDLPCSNTANPEEIQVNTLDGSLGYINKANNEVGVLLEPKAKPGPFVEFHCGNLNLAVGAAQAVETSRYGNKETGPVEAAYSPNGGDGIISPITPVNTMTNEFTQVYSVQVNALNGWENVPNAFEGGPLRVLEDYFWNTGTEVEGRWAPAAEEITNVNHIGGYAEIRG